jgi:pyruvyl transferase EpsO
MTRSVSPSDIAKQALATLKEALRGHTRCALLDFPDHGNVGDSAIWSGEIEALGILGVAIAYVATGLSFDARVLRERMPEGVILIHGGGNFGTIWPECQAHREAILQQFRDYPVIQLPQSIHFDNNVALERTRGLIAAHPDFTMLVRDEPSRVISETQLKARTRMCSDSAFFLHVRLKRAAPAVDILALARSDRERATNGLVASLVDSGRTFEIVDWLDEPMTRSRRLAAVLWPRAFGRLTRVPGFFRLLEAAWNAAASARIERGCTLLSRGRVVVTDRLHAHILCTMLGIPHVVLDNSYGKVQNFIAAWTRDSPLVHRASNPQEAVASASALLAPAQPR